MRFQTEPINFHDSQTGQVRLKPLKREIDRRIHNILAYLLNVPLFLSIAISTINTKTRCLNTVFYDLANTIIDINIYSSI